MRKTLQINIAVDTWVKDDVMKFYREDDPVYVETVQHPDNCVKFTHPEVSFVVKIDDLKRAIAAAERGMR